MVMIEIESEIKIRIRVNKKESIRKIYSTSSTTSNGNKEFKAEEVCKELEGYLIVRIECR